MNIIITCEHAVNTVPKEFSGLIDKELLHSHKGFDLGASTVAEKLGKALELKPFYGKISRLVVDLNRSPNNKKIFSQYTNKLSPEEKQHLIDKYHAPFRDKVLKACSAPTTLISIHSFTPVLDGKVRKADLGILYDPERKNEKELAIKLKNHLKHMPIKTLKNSPYQGKSDGTAAWLRKHFSDNDFLGFELEFNQKLFSNSQFLEKLVDEISTFFKSCFL